MSSNRGNFFLLFQIIPDIDLNSTSGHVGDTLLVSGAGFRASRVVNIYFNNSNIVNSSTSADGILSPVSFRLPAIRGGSYNLYASDNVAYSTPIVVIISPHLIASSLQGSAGDQLKLDGTGFDDNSGINIYWDSQLINISAIFTDNTGSFTTNISVPPSTTGNHVIRARDNLLGTDAVTFTVSPRISIDPSSSTPRGIVSITGRGFRGNASVNILFEGATILTQPTSIATDSTGSFAAGFTVPTIRAGSYTIRANDGIYSATTIITIASLIELTPSGGNIGTEVLVNGIGFTPAGGVVLSYDNETLISITTDNSGAFSISFNIPVSGAGQHTITARDLSTQGIVATATFVMESNPPSVPNMLTPVYDTMTDTQPRFTWTAVSDPSGVAYDLQIAWDANFSRLVLFKQGLTQPQYQLAQSERLELTKKANPYYWRVRAIDGAGNASDWTIPGSFYTEDSTPPPTPTLLSPENGSRKGRNVLFDWTDVSDPSGVTYTLQVALDSSFNQLVVYKEGLGSSEYQLTKMEELASTTGNPPSPYYCRVRAEDGAHNQSDWSNVNGFYVGWVLQGWLLYAAMVIGGILLMVIGIFIGMRIRPSKKASSS